MGMTQALEKEVNVCGGIDFGHLRHLELTHLSGGRSPSFQVVVRQSALNRVHSHGDSAPRVEVCGVLVGEVYRDSIGAYTLVEHIIEGQSSASSAGQVTFTADTWQHIQVLMDRQYPDLRIVGWYHTHPGHGVFLSEMDVFLHESFFGLPWQSALVYDPRSGDLGLFSAHEGHAQQLNFLVEEDEPASVKPVRRDGTGGEEEGAASKETVKGAKPLPASRPKNRLLPGLGRFFLAIIGLLLFTCMGALLGLLIRQQHLELPYWIQRMTHG